VKISGAATPHLKYRPDIDGLRAIAIISVLIFHAFPLALPGGFIGVDIFFVISGYLIATIIFRELRSGTFNFLEFYRRRISRIFPALILVLATCYIVGWFTLIAPDFKTLGKHIAGGFGFVQNLILYKEDGYFDAASESKFLLHLWSLGVEEQFYIFFPLGTWLVWKRPKFIFPVITLAMLVSLFSGVRMLSISHSAAFYMPQFRFWEILFGSMLAHRGVFPGSFEKIVESSKNLSNLLSLVGIALLITSLVLINPIRNFPGFWALLPVSGALLVIMAGSKAWLNQYILANRVMVWIGLISYPLYLWHWVIFTYIRLVNAQELTLYYGLVAILISVMFSFLTYKLVELPLRRLKTSVSKTGAYVLLGLALASTGLMTFFGNGIPSRPGTDIYSRSEYAQYFVNTLPEWEFATKHHLAEAYRSECDFFDIYSYRFQKSTMEPRKEISVDCYTPKTGTKIMLWGDSHAQQYNYGLSHILPASISVLQVASSGCEANFPNKPASSRKYCDYSNTVALEVMEKEKPNILIIAQSEGHDTINDLAKLTARAKSLGVQDVIVIGPVPHYAPYLYQVISNKYWSSTPKRIMDNIVLSSVQTDKLLSARYKSGAGGFDYLSAMNVFCNHDGCMTYLGSDRKTGLVTYDYGHLVPEASLYFAKTALAPLIMKHLATQSAAIRYAKH
jgi:peptidoglycan/LPS O-acetylase OafA/YrhL